MEYSVQLGSSWEEHKLIAALLLFSVFPAGPAVMALTAGEQVM